MAKRWAWSEKECLEIALKYKTKKEWKKADRLSYRAALNNKWMDTCSAHMVEEEYWTLERCKESARPYKTRTEWQKAKGTAYFHACNNRWIDECCEHMEVYAHPSTIYWTYERCIESTKGHRNITEWRNKNSGAARAAKNNDWWDDIVDCFDTPVDLTNGLTLKDCSDSALKFELVVLWKLLKPMEHLVAVRNGWSQECTRHMKQTAINF